MITTKLKLKPFSTPNFVIPERPPSRREDGVQFNNGIPLHELDDETIRELLDQFRLDVWAKVNQRRAADHQGVKP